METIGKSQLWSYSDNKQKVQRTSNEVVRRSGGHAVNSYLGLAKKIAELQFRNPEHVLLFRGQHTDYKNINEESSLKPSLFRQSANNSRMIYKDLIQDRFSHLKQAENIFLDKISSLSLGRDEKVRLTRYRILRWAILQHYEVCFTPLLDVTQSLRVATSFAFDGASEFCYLYVIAVPNISGSISASAEVGIQCIRLSSVCPPRAIRPHIQEGYLLGEYPEMQDFDQKRHYEAFEIDFGRRIIAKFKLSSKDFQGDDLFPVIRRDALYPDVHDTFIGIARDIQKNIGSQV